MSVMRMNSRGMLGTTALMLGLLGLLASCGSNPAKPGAEAGAPGDAADDSIDDVLGDAVGTDAEVDARSDTTDTFTDTSADAIDTADDVVDTSTNASCTNACAPAQHATFCNANEVQWDCFSSGFDHRPFTTNCRDAATNLVRYCCPATFNPRCD